MPAFADDFGAAGDDAADHRVGLDEPLPRGRQVQGPPHVPEVQFVRIHHWPIQGPLSPGAGDHCDQSGVQIFPAVAG